MVRSDTFFPWQHRMLGWLLGWGVGSVVVGAALATDAQPAVRQIGIQAVAWGAIDAGLAWNGRRSARARQFETEAAAAQRRPIAEEVKRFRMIIAVNTGLDVLYVLGGLGLVETAGKRASRRGTGLGIALQGLFLLGFDGYLLRQLMRQSGDDWSNDA